MKIKIIPFLRHITGQIVTARRMLRKRYRKAEVWKKQDEDTRRKTEHIAAVVNKTNGVTK